MNIISLSQSEFEENVPFSLSLVEKGHTLKVTTNNGIVCINIISSWYAAPTAIQSGVLVTSATRGGWRPWRAATPATEPA